MTVYVDCFGDGWGRWSHGGHMLTSDIRELHDMARRVGLRPEWFQDKRIPHYDLTARKRTLALAYGAVSIDIGHIPDDVVMRSTTGQYVARSELLARKCAAERRERGGDA